MMRMARDWTLISSRSWPVYTVPWISLAASDDSDSRFRRPYTGQLTLAEADADVALEADVVAGRELEGVKVGGEDAAGPVVVPLAEYLGVRGTAVVVRHEVLVLTVVVHRVGHAVPGEAAVDGVRLDVHLEHELVADLGAVDVLAVGVADPHGAGGGRAGVGDGAGRRQGVDVEADLYVCFSGVVDTSDPVGLGLEGDKFGMLLDHQDEVGFSLKKQIY